MSFLLSKVATATNCRGHTKLSERFALIGTYYEILFRTCTAMIGFATTSTANGSELATGVVLSESKNRQLTKLKNWKIISNYLILGTMEAVMLG